MQLIKGLLINNEKKYWRKFTELNKNYVNEWKLLTEFFSKPYLLDKACISSFFLNNARFKIILLIIADGHSLIAIFIDINSLTALLYIV